MIYTSYFGKLKSLPKNIIPIAICAKSPNFYNGLEYKKLAPKYGFFMEWKQTHDNYKYVKCFKEQVTDKLNVDEVISDFKNLVQDENVDIVLVCYEKPNDFCHRHLVAKWLTENGYPCQEWTSNQ